MTKIDEIVARFRNELDAAGSKFFMAYTVPSLHQDEVSVKLTSNSSREGIQAILAAFLRPTKAAVDLLAKELAGSARAGMDLKEDEIVGLVASGKFTDGAKLLFEQLRMLYTIAGWESEFTKATTPTKLV